MPTVERALPRHVAIIMDGNGRWAQSRGLPRVMGHRAGIKSVRAVVEAAREQGVEALTLYAFSVENWKRSRQEVNTLMRLLDEYLARELPTLLKNQVGLNVIGRLEGLPPTVQRHLRGVMAKTRPGAKMILTLALNYGGRTEILDAVRRLADDVAAGVLTSAAIDEPVFSRYLYTDGLPDPDLLIRTSGELRISNFLLWQISYTELYITQTLWPDFGKPEFLEALRAFQRRERRFGAAEAPARR
ncbi:MAG: di-trans,poly-cis-decaprenylcistransferase [Omnitrophica WOR_2 bacterium RIFCSPHIGHO2_02_FULL_68_15]|nr:MAG: di-trans,poly-cis-decaprenylcistransferase [Omnitrophica WOR_2 bacterium RIFCSPHIGHO2_02_FULL_68_15]